MSNWETYQPMMRFANERVKTDIDPEWSIEHITSDVVTEKMRDQGINIAEDQISIVIKYNGTVIDSFVTLKSVTGASFIFNIVQRRDDICKLYQTASYSQGR